MSMLALRLMLVDALEEERGIDSFVEIFDLLSADSDGVPLFGLFV